MTKNEVIVELFEKWDALRKQRFELEKEESALKSALAAAIPANQSRAGIKNVTVETKSVAYKRALERTFDELVPKTKRFLLDEFVLACTTTSTRTEFKREDR